MHSAIKTLVAAGPLAMMVSGPFLLPFHTQPIPSFWNEWWAAAMGLGAAITGLALWRDRPLALPLALWIPALLLVLLLFQFLIGRLVFPAVGLLHSIYLLWAGLLVVLGKSLAETLSIEKLAELLATALLLGSLLGAGMALAQWLGLAQSSTWIFRHPGGLISANLGQANHHAHYCWLGLASAFYLRGSGRIAVTTFWLAVSMLAFASILGGSRSVFLYALVPLAVIIGSGARVNEAPFRKLRNEAIILLPLVIALNFLATYATAFLPPLATTPGERLFSLVSGTSIRLALAQTAWLAFLDAPWIGHGVGNFSWASFIVASTASGGATLQVAEHAHNLILQMLVEFGAPATLCIVLVLILWTRNFLNQTWQLAHIWCACILLIGMIHGMLEYPHWYAYFLGPAALLLGAFDTKPALRLAGRRIWLYLFAVTITGSAILFNLRQEYSRIEAVTYHPLALHADREQSWRIAMDQLLQLHRESLLAPWALLALATMAEPSDKQTVERMSLCERAIRFSPARTLVTQCAMQYAIAGKTVEAERLLQAALRAFPAEKAQTTLELKKWAVVFPVLTPLLMAGQE